VSFRSNRTSDCQKERLEARKKRSNIGFSWIKETPRFQLLTEEEIASVIFFYLFLSAKRNPSSCTMTIGVYSASNRNEYQKIFLGSKARPACKADNITGIYEPIV
jgi:hypothetical protein